jgi:hypothetical protein
LSDTEIYTEKDNDRTNCIASQIITRSKYLKINKFINKTECRKIYPVNYCLPNVYALIKIHKSGNPCRIICPYFEHLASKLSQFLSNLITPSIRNSEYSLKDSSEFANITKSF